MATVITNTKTAQASRSQTVIVTVGQDELTLKDQVKVGDPCVVSSGKLGHVVRVDQLGYYIFITPNNPTERLESSDTIGYLRSEDTITFN